MGFKNIIIPQHTRTVFFCDVCQKRIAILIEHQNNGKCNKCIGQRTLLNKFYGTMGYKKK